MSYVHMSGDAEALRRELWEEARRQVKVQMAYDFKVDALEHIRNDVSVQDLKSQLVAIELDGTIYPHDKDMLVKSYKAAIEEAIERDAEVEAARRKDLELLPEVIEIARGLVANGADEKRALNDLTRTIHGSVFTRLSYEVRRVVRAASLKDVIEKPIEHWLDAGEVPF